MQSSPTEWPQLAGTRYADAKILDEIGGGRRCRAFRVRQGERDLVLKHYSTRGLVRHRRYSTESLANYEFRRNLTLYRIPSLAPYVARPVGFVSDGSLQLFMQEFVAGMPLRIFCATGAAQDVAVLIDELVRIVARAHSNDFYDLDLHLDNVLVVRSATGAARPVLFDFNKLPYDVAPPNALFGCLVNLGCIDRRSRDFRHLRKMRAATRSRRSWQSWLYSSPVTTLVSECEPLLMI